MNIIKLSVFVLLFSVFLVKGERFIRYEEKPECQCVFRKKEKTRFSLRCSDCPGETYPPRF
jgi:hypothetical protein